VLSPTSIVPVAPLFVGLPPPYLAWLPVHASLACRRSAPPLVLQSFRVEFEVNIIVAFEDGYMVTENFPISLYRSPK